MLVAGSSSQLAVLTNTGNSTVNISQVVVSGAGFTAGGFAVPLALPAGQSATLTVSFSPTIAGGVTGSVTIVSNATNSPTTIALSGTGTAQTFQRTSSATSLTFGSVLVGTLSSSQTVAITNSGNSSVTISGFVVSGAGFTVSDCHALMLVAGQSASLSVAFSPATVGSVTGRVSVVDKLATKISLTGTGVQPQISVLPSPVAFGKVVVGTSNSQTLVVQNSGTASLSVSQANGGRPGI